MIEMAHVSNIRFEFGNELREIRIQHSVSVAIFSLRMVYKVKIEAAALILMANGEIGRIRVFLSGENRDSMGFRQLVANGLAVNFRPRIVMRRIAMNDLENVHLVNLENQ
tara:strand:+ start:172 stop:501 length:330 start_codon:yes stop_codon:yes gene_type:complete